MIKRSIFFVTVLIFLLLQVCCGFAFFESGSNGADYFNGYRACSEGAGGVERLSIEVNNGVRTVNGKPIKINPGQQDKHIPGTNNYKQELANGKPRSILNENPNQLLDDYAGTGQKINDYKERIDFGKNIGQYYDEVTGTYTDTSIGIVTYGNKGAHIIPARPK